MESVLRSTEWLTQVICFTLAISQAIGFAVVTPWFAGLCPGGGGYAGSCMGGCPSGFSCYNGGCCPLPRCPSGNVAVQFGCHSCMGTCYQGCCCQTVIQVPSPSFVSCPAGGLSSAPCGEAGCGMHSSCYQGRCCPLVQCPSGGWATGFCETGGCDNGSCHEGCCCPKPVTKVHVERHTITHCRQSQTVVGSCDSTCGGSATCVNQKCCIERHYITKTVIPGRSCGCSGGCCHCGCSVHSTCVQGSCQCNRGFANAGEQCAAATWPIVHYSPRPCQGPECTSRKEMKPPRKTFKFSADLEGSNETIRLEIHQTLTNFTRVCSSHCTCPPEQICVEEECRMRMVPGQEGCEHDMQCNFDCHTAYCDGVDGMCRCRSGQFAFVEVGLCYRACPEGTSPTMDGLCKRVDPSDLLFENRWIQMKLQRTHTCGNIGVKDCTSDDQPLEHVQNNFIDDTDIYL